MKKITPPLLLILFLAGRAAAQDYDVLVQQALRQRDSGDFAAAERTLRQAYAIPADKSEASYLLAMMLAFQQRYGEALDLLDTALETYPDNVDLQLARARVLSYQGVYQDASATIDRVLALQPTDIEALNLAGRIALYQRRPVDAQQRFNQVLRQDAMNLEALLGLYDSHMQRGDSSAASPYLDRAAAVAPGQIDVLVRQNPAQYDPQPRHQLSAGLGRSTIDRSGFADWNDRFFEYRHLQPNGNQQYLRAEHNHRFGAHDTLYEAGIAVAQQSRLPLEFAIGFTPDDDFLAEYYGRMQGSTPLTDGSGDFGTVIVTGLLQYSSYANGSTKRGQLGLEYYLPNADVWLTPAIGLVHDQDGMDTFAWSMGLHWQITGSSRIGASYSDAPETENRITTDSESIGAYLRQSLNDRWVLLLNYNRHDREGSYTRESWNLTLQYRY
jgi:YaiO family outer membrane protein